MTSMQPLYRFLGICAEKCIVHFSKSPEVALDAAGSNRVSTVAAGVCWFCIVMSVGG